MSRSTLPDLQDRFHQFVVAGDNTFRHDIVDDGRVDVDVRLAVYYDGYRLRLIEALETDFVALRTYLGEEKFDDLARAYIDAHTSDHFSLRHFGRHLAAFLPGRAPWKNEPLLADIATFEWAMTHAFDAEDAPLATVADMAAIAPEDWPELSFALHPSVQRIDIRWNAPALWNAADRKEPLPAAEQSPWPVGWVIWRQELQLYFRSLSVDQAWMLDALRDGRNFADRTKSTIGASLHRGPRLHPGVEARVAVQGRTGCNFAAICEGLTEWIDARNVALHAASLLKQWLEDGMISGIRTGY